jgi:hypothetical protein
MSYSPSHSSRARRRATAFLLLFVLICLVGFGAACWNVFRAQGVLMVGGVGLGAITGGLIAIVIFAPARALSVPKSQATKTYLRGFLVVMLVASSPIAIVSVVRPTMSIARSSYLDTSFVVLAPTVGAMIIYMLRMALHDYRRSQTAVPYRVASPPGASNDRHGA